MSWYQYDAFGGRSRFRHDGDTDDFCAALLNDNEPAEIDRVSAGVSYQVVSLSADHQIRIAIRSSVDGRQNVQAGIVDHEFLAAIGTTVSAGLYAVCLRKDSSALATFDYNAAYTLLARSTSDLVTEGFIGSTTERDTLIEVRTQSGRLKLYINGNLALTDASTDDYLLTDDDFPYFPAFGFVSHVNQAVAKNPSRAALIPQRGTTTQLTAIVSGGELYVSTNGARPQRKGVVAAPDSEVSAAFGDGYIFFVDGENFYYYDYPNDTVAKMGPGNGNDYWTVGGGGITGAPVGADPDPADTVNRRVTGSTTATQVAIFNNRLYLAADRTLQASAVGDFFDFNSGDTADGRSFTLADESASSTIRSPIVNLTPYEKDYLLIGCMGEVHVMRGDPIFEDSVVENITRDMGAAGPDSVSIGDQGFAWILTENGLCRVSGSGIAQVSSATLQLEIAKGGDWISYRPKVCRDSSNEGVLVYYTPFEADGDIYHFWFDETSLGVFPEKYPAELGPTAVGKVNHEVLVGSRNGYIYVYDEEQTSDEMATLDGGDTTITTTCPVGLIMDTDGLQLTMTTQAAISLSNDSGTVQIKFYVGRSPEDAYTITTPVATFSVSAGRNFLPVRVAGGAIVPVITSPISAATGWSIDYLHVDTLAGGLIPPLPRPTAAAVATPDNDFGDDGDGSDGDGDGPIEGSGGGGDITGSFIPALLAMIDTPDGQYEIPTFDFGSPDSFMPETPGDVSAPGSGGPGGEDVGWGGGGISPPASPIDSVID